MLSGFSNSGGGIVIWGIATEKNNEKIDQAIELKPFSDPASVAGQFYSLVSRVVLPAVPDVKCRHVLGDNGSDGYVVALIPKSQNPPHRTSIGKCDYYRRYGDSFLSLDHWGLADLFGRRPQPCLKPFVKCFWKTSHKKFEVQFGLNNIGPGMAKFPAIRAEVFPHPSYSIYCSGLNGEPGLPYLPRWSDGRQRMFGGGANDVIYPGDSCVVSWITHGAHPQSAPELKFAAKVFAENMIPTSHEIIVDVASAFQSGLVR